MKVQEISKYIAAIAIAAVMSIGMTSTVFAACVATQDGFGVQTQDLLAGQTILAGTVSAQVIDTDNDTIGDTLQIIYTTTGGWELMETHLWVGDDLGDMPQTRQGNPKIGNFPYNSGDITGNTSYTVEVPLSVLGFSCPTADKDYFIAAHAALRKPDGSGGYQTETGWADGDRFVERGAWGTFFTTTLTCDCDGGGTEVSGCETAFAVFDSDQDLIPDSDSRCFLDIDEDEDEDGDFNRWGWSNIISSTGTHNLDIYAGAGQCDLTKGTYVGTLMVYYDGSIADVTYIMSEQNPTTGLDYTMDETHLNISNEILPRDVKGDFTVAPGQYESIHDELNGATVDTHILNESGDIYVVAHAVVCGFPQ